VERISRDELDAETRVFFLVPRGLKFENSQTQPEFPQFLLPSDAFGGLWLMHLCRAECLVLVYFNFKSQMMADGSVA
jgi:hypothetical protein